MKLLAPLLLAGAFADEELTKREKYELQCGKAQTQYPNCPCLDWYWKGGKKGRNLMSGKKGKNRIYRFYRFLSEKNGFENYTFPRFTLY